MLRLIRCGADDDKIIEEYEKNKLQPKKRFKFVEKVLYVLMCVAFGAVFAASLFMSCTQKVYFEGIPTYRVVQTGSMEKKYEKNYLKLNSLQDKKRSPTF
jgi:cell division protein FtsL